MATICHAGRSSAVEVAYARKAYFDSAEDPFKTGIGLVDIAIQEANIHGFYRYNQTDEMLLKARAMAFFWAQSPMRSPSEPT